MAGRFPAARLIVLVLAVLLAACVEVTPGSGPRTPEADLARQARALQRSVLEGAATGAVAGAGGAYVFGGRGNVPGGIFIGIPVGMAAGTYVGYLQQNYASNEARLERLRADVEATNAETEAAIRTMRVVLARQRQQLAAIRAGAAAPPDGLPVAERSLGDMTRAIDGAERRLDEFSSTRALRLVEGQLTGVDAQIGELGRRIAEMRSIAETLAGEILMRAAARLALIACAGCVQSDDPAAGGFLSGVAGIAGGGYEARATERETALAAAETRGTALAAELAGLEREQRALQDRLVAQRAALRGQGVRLSAATEGRIQAALTGPPAAPDPAARAAALQRAIADARRLSEQLAALAG